MISLGAPAPQFAPASGGSLGSTPDLIYVVAVGPAVRRKNLDRLMTALAQLGADDVHLLVVGDGPEQASLAALAARLGWRRVQFRGYVPEETKYQLAGGRHLRAAVAA